MPSALSEDAAARVHAVAAATPLLAEMGATIAALGAGHCTIAAPFDRRFGQQNGFLHAGVVTALLDAAAGFAALSAMPPDSDVLSVEFKVNLLAPATGERFEACAETLRSGRMLSVVRADLYAIAGGVRRPVATFLGTMIRRTA